jgi:FMN-dependent NADH-azoreductase
MKKVLVINGYISDDSQSTTHAVVEKFLAYYQAKNPDDEIITLDLNDVPMASITLSRQNAWQLILMKMIVTNTLNN